MPNGWELDREWAEDPSTEDFRAHLRDRLRNLRKRLESLASSESLDQVRFVAGQIAELKTTLKETTRDEDSERQQEGAG